MKPTKLQVYIILFLLSVIAVFGCNTVKKATATFDSHKGDAARYCQDRFPIKPTTITKIKTINGKPDTTVLPGETVYVNCDSAIALAWDEASKKHVAVKCPPTLRIHDSTTVYIHDSTTVLDTREITIVQIQNDSLRSQVVVYQGKFHSWRKGGIACGVLALCFLILFIAAITGRLSKIV